MIAWIFLHPVELGINHLWLVLPLCALLAVVYKTVRVPRLAALPLQVLSLWAYILAGLAVLGVGFYLLLEYVA